MKFIIPSLLFVSIFITSCQENSTQPGTGDWTGYDLMDVPNTDHQKATLTSKNGETLEEGFIRNGVKDGQWIYYNPKGEYISKIENYINGQLNGMVFEINGRHEMTTRTDYFGGRKDGYHGEYKRARLKKESYYKDGKLHGRTTQYHDHSNNVLSETDYKNGKQDGIYRYYDPQGNVTLDYLYKDGEKVRGGIVDSKESE